MKRSSASGLTLVELVVVVLVLGILSAALFPAGTNPIFPSMAAVGMRGRDIYVALASANVEREALGMASLWPRDVVSGGVTNASVSGMPEFVNSTDYFAWLLMAQDGAIPGWNPQVKELGFDKLSGAGVKPCPTNRCLTAENNLWTVAKNVREDTDDLIPVLVTRNIDASSLAARADEHDLKERALRFDPAWRAPFGKKGYVMIRKGGAIFKARAKHMTWGVVYQNQVFDTALTTNGMAAPPLKYLTPDREVVPGH